MNGVSTKKHDAPKVAVIVLNWNGWQDTSACIHSLQQSRYPNFSILVVDNGSTDGSLEELRRKYPGLDILETGENLGFARGNNIGIEYALSTWGPEYVWLLNNDTLVQGDALDLLVQTAEDRPRIGALGTVLVDADNPEVVQACGGKSFGLWTGVPWPSCSQRPPNFLHGASLFLRRACLDQCGFFDPGYFFYFEDTEFCFRITRFKWELATDERVVVLHKGSASIGAQSFLQAYWYRVSLIRFLISHAPLPWLPIITTTAIRLVLAGLAGNTPVLRGTWKGFCDGVQAGNNAGREFQSG